MLRAPYEHTKKQELRHWLGKDRIPEFGSYANLDNSEASHYLATAEPRTGTRSGGPNTVLLPGNSLVQWWTDDMHIKSDTPRFRWPTNPR